MTKAKLIREICLREGKKSQVKIGDVREILSILEDICVEWHLNEGTHIGSSGFLPYAMEALDGPLYPSISKKFKEARKRKGK